MRTMSAEPPPQPAPQPPVYAPSPLPPRKSRAPLIAAVVLVAVVILALAGSYAVSNLTVNSLQLVCASTQVSSITIFPPSASLAITYGISNPSSLSVGAEWVLSFSVLGVFKSDTQTFTIPAGGVAHPTFRYTFTASDVTGISGGSVTVSITASYHVLLYTFSQYFSTTGASGGSSSTPSLPSC